MNYFINPGISMPGGWEIWLVFIVVILIFGPKKLPELARGLGKAIREFRKAKDDVHDAIMEEGNALEDKETDKTVDETKTEDGDEK